MLQYVSFIISTLPIRFLVPTKWTRGPTFSRFCSAQSTTPVSTVFFLATGLAFADSQKSSVASCHGDQRLIER